MLSSCLGIGAFLCNWTCYQAFLIISLHIIIFLHCWVAAISLLTLAVTLLRSWRWDELLWWRFLLEAYVAPGRLSVGLVCSAAARWESRYSLLCKDNISCNNVYIIKTLIFCIHILVVCITTWSWAYIWWASGFGLKTGCDTMPLEDPSTAANSHRTASPRSSPLHWAATGHLHMDSITPVRSQPFLPTIVFPPSLWCSLTRSPATPHHRLTGIPPAPLPASMEPPLPYFPFRLPAQSVLGRPVWAQKEQWHLSIF
jgi:hypothetical protein